MTTLIAGYAAVVATISLLWQVWTSSRAKRPEVAVMLDTWRIKHSGAGKRYVEDVNIRVRNREDYPVRVQRLYLRYPWYYRWPSVPAVIDTGDASRVPFDLPPREVMTFTARPAEDYWLPRPDSSGREHAPLVTVELRTGERYTGRRS